MASDVIVPHWPRPHYDPSPQGPELFYLIVGEQPEGSTLQLSRGRHHIDRIEESIRISKHRRSDDPAWFDAWFSGHLGAYLDQALREDSEPVRRSNQLTVVRGSFPDQPSLGYLRNTLGVVSAVADAGALAIFDVYSFTWWRPDEWRSRFVDRSEFRIDEHIFIPVTDEPRHRPGLWTHTRGMRKFGRPDLHIRHLPGPYDTSNPAIRDSGTLLNGIANYLAGGAVVAAGQTMHLPSFDATVAFLATDDPETQKHFSGPSLEVCEIDPELGVSKPGVCSLLRRMAGLRGSDN
jgi:hypothetical protein